MTEDTQSVIDIICLNCVKDEDLKLLIKNKGHIVSCCNICGSRSIKAIEYEEKGEFYQAVRSLIRFYFNEWDYNGHWGGEHFETLILENKILFSDLFFDNEEKSLDIINSIFDEAYFDSEKGVSMFYGYTEDGAPAGFYFAIQKEKNRLIENLKLAVKRQDYRQLFQVVSKIVDACEEHLTLEISNLLLFRARIGVKRTGSHFNESFLDPFPKLRSTPFVNNEIGAPPFEKAEIGRMNRVGFSFLYLAEDVETAVVEVRPAPGDLVSIGVFKQQENIKILDFTKLTIREFWLTDNLLDKFRDLYGIVKYVSTHFGTNGKHNYLFTQLISEELIRRGFKGIKHASSFTMKSNYVIFEPSMFENIPKDADVVEVEDIEIIFKKAPLLDEKEAVPQSIK